MSQNERIASLLSTGISPAQVASIVGISPARISQLFKDDEEFKAIVAEKIEENAKKDIEEINISGKYLAAEHALIDQVLMLAPASEMRDVVGALRVVAERQNAAKIRNNPIQNGQPVIHNIVQINLPSHALASPSVQLTQNKEVIAIGDQALAPLSSQGVENLFSQLRNKGKNNGNELEGSLAEASGGYKEVTSTKASPEDTTGQIIDSEDFIILSD